MVFSKITDKTIDEVCGWLEFYDEHRFLPFRKKKVTMSLNGIAYERLVGRSNKSKFVEDLIIRAN
jgi:hypothetical protein